MGRGLVPQGTRQLSIGIELENNETTFFLRHNYGSEN
jgi:hypothetical protein